MKRGSGFAWPIAGIGGLSVACAAFSIQFGCSSTPTGSGAVASDSTGAASPPAASAAPSGHTTYRRLDNGLIETHRGSETHYMRANCEEPDPAGYRCFSYVETDPEGTPLHPDGIPTNTPALTAAQLQQAYAIPQDPTPNATIGLVSGSSSVTLEADMNQYRTQNGLPACTSASGCLQIVNASGSTPVSSPTTDAGAPAYGGWAGEITLDTQMASAACPGCKIVVVVDDSGFYPAFARAVALGANVVSFSGGSPEQPGESSEDAQFAALGVPLFASTGDNGINALTPGNPSYSPYGEVQHPAALSSFIGVGGTELDPTPGATFADGTPRGFIETAWDWGPWVNPVDGGPGNTWGGTAWGCSQYEPKPAWQTDTGCAMRTVGDVAAIAGAPKVAIVVGGNGVVASGTSVASPLVAAIVAQTHAWGMGNAYPYQHPASFSDVTHNTDVTATCPGGDAQYLCAAVPGYDSPTGNGSPIGYRLAALSGRPVITGVSPSSGPTSGGTEVTITGLNLSGASIDFGLTPAPGFTCAATSCTGPSPWTQGHGTSQTVDVQAFVNGTPSFTSPLDQFTYLAGPACTGTMACISGSGGYPWLEIQCASTVDFYALADTPQQYLATVGTSFQVHTSGTAQNIAACATGGGSCTTFLAYEPTTTTCGMDNCPAGQVQQNGNCMVSSSGSGSACKTCRANGGTCVNNRCIYQ
jgi:hypothetical protein